MLKYPAKEEPSFHLLEYDGSESLSLRHIFKSTIWILLSTQENCTVDDLYYSRFGLTYLTPNW